MEEFYCITENSLGVYKFHVPQFPSSLSTYTITQATHVGPTNRSLDFLARLGRASLGSPGCSLLGGVGRGTVLTQCCIIHLISSEASNQ